MFAAAGSDTAQARALAARLGLVCVDASPARGMTLAVTAQRLELWPSADAGARPIFADFAGSEIIRRARAGRRSLLARALGLHRRPDQSVFDATCGLGRDSAVLLTLGCTVRACERAPVLAALVADAARRHIPPAGTWLGIETGDARDILVAADAPVADSIYIDPMFDESRRSALPKRELQVVRTLAGADHDAGALLAIARQRAARQVVVKRHPRAAPLASGARCLRGRRVCFDIYPSA